MAENVPYLGRDMAIQVQEAQKSPNRFNSKILTDIHCNQSLKSQKHKENLEGSNREKSHHTQKNPDGAVSRLLSRTSQASRGGDTFQVLGEENLIQQYFTQPSCPSAMKERYVPKQKLSRLITTRPALQKMLKGVL